MNIQGAYRQMAASLRRTMQKLTAGEKKEALWGTLLCRDLDNSITTAHFADDAITAMPPAKGAITSVDTLDN